MTANIKPKILIVEDDPIVASDIKYKLRDFGYDVSGTAATGEAAIAAVRAHKPAAVLMDITLEGQMDGIQAADTIRRELNVPIVYLTAHSDQATVQRAKLTLPYGYVLKPIREIELKIALEMAIYSGAQKQEAAGEKVPPSAGFRPSKLSEAERVDIKGRLAGLEPFKGISDKLLDEISGQCVIREFSPLEVISMEGQSDAADGFIVLSGRVAMFKTSLNGRELVVQLVGPRSSFGLLASLDSGAQELTVRAQIESRLILVPKYCILYLLAAAPQLYPDFLAELSRRINSIHNMARSLAHDKVDIRVAATLLALIESGEGEISADSKFEIKMSRQELANLAGTTVETAIRITRGLEDEGILDFPDHRLIRVIEPKKLRLLAQGV